MKLNGLIWLTYAIYVCDCILIFIDGKTNSYLWAILIFCSLTFMLWGHIRYREIMQRIEYRKKILEHFIQQFEKKGYTHETESK